MHNHMPIKQKYSILRCLRLLVSPKKLFHYYTEGTSVCSECSTSITFPEAYISPVSAIIYFLAGCAIGRAASLLPYLRTPAALLLMCVFHHIYSAVILSFFPWEACDLTKRSAKAFCEDAKKELTKKVHCLLIGFVIGGFLYYLGS